MKNEIKNLEEKVNSNPFDEKLRTRYATMLCEDGQQQQGLVQWKILSQQFPENAVYISNVSDLEIPKEEEREVETETSVDPVTKKITGHGLKLVEGVEQNSTSHNIVNLASVHKVRFIDIAGMKAIKKIIRRRIVDPFINPSLFQKFKRKAGGGVLLFGPPGCGKTMMAKAIATECKASFHSIGISDILNMYIGESESNLANIFAQARNSAPAVLFFDELDALAYSRSKANSDHTRTLVNEFLSQLDGLTGENDQVLVLGATNMPWDVDDAMKRPGRFDRQIFVPPPDAEAITEMLAAKLREVPCDTINFKRIAHQCKQFSGADIDGLIEAAKDNALDDIMDSGEERLLNENDLLMALDDVNASTIEWLQTAQNLVKYANAAGAYKDVAKYLKSNGVY